MNHHRCRCEIALVLIGALLLAGTAQAKLSNGTKWTEVCNSSNAAHCRNLVGIACVSKSVCYTSTLSGVYLFDVERSTGKLLLQGTGGFLSVGGTASAPAGFAVVDSIFHYFASPVQLARSQLDLGVVAVGFGATRDGRDILVMSLAKVFYSGDGGRSFKEVPVPHPDGVSQCQTAAVVNATTWFVAVDSADSTKTAVMKTVDGGRTFTSMDPTAVGLSAVCWATDLYAMGRSKHRISPPMSVSRGRIL